MSIPKEVLDSGSSMEAQEDALKIALGWEWRVFSLGLGR